MTQSLRIALYTGALVRYDAISTSAQLKIDLIESCRQGGASVELDVFVQTTDRTDGRIHVCRDVWDALRHPAHRGAQLHIFEFGIYYDLFDAVFAVPEHARAVGVYHNITPIEFIAASETRRAVGRAHVQRFNLFEVDHVVCDSEFNRQELVDLGLPPDRTSVLSLPPGPAAAWPAAGGGNKPSKGSTVELLYVGRLVRAKGVLDLVAAIQRLLRRGVEGIRLTLCGSAAFSDADVVRQLDSACSSWPSHVRVLRDTCDAELGGLLRSAEIFVMPSYHEGYCVPVLEALAAGCEVVAYDSSNLPDVTGGLGQLVPTGDVDALADAIERCIQYRRSPGAKGSSALVPTMHGDLLEPEWREWVADHLAARSHDAYVAGFFDILRRMTAALPAGCPRWPNKGAAPKAEASA